MPSYLVECVDPHTEQTSTQPIDAHTPEQARARAIEMGFIAGGVVGLRRAIEEQKADGMSIVMRWATIAFLCAVVVLIGKWSYERLKEERAREERNARGLFFPRDLE